MFSVRSLVLAVAVLAFPTVLAACGDDGNTEVEDEIRRAIEVSATSTDPSVCTELQTQSFTEQTSGETGEKAVQDCRRSQQEEAVAESVEVSEIEIDDNSATAVTALTGGFIEGQSLELGLVEEDGQWKLDELIGFVDFDRAQYIDGFVQGIAEEAENPEAIQGCVRQALEGLSDEDLQAAFLENEERALDEALGPCFEGQQG